MPHTVSGQPRSNPNEAPPTPPSAALREPYLQLSKVLLQLSSPPYFAVISDLPGTLFAPRAVREAVERGAQVTIYKQHFDLAHARTTRPDPANATEVARTHQASAINNRAVQAQLLTAKLIDHLDVDD